LPQELQQVIQSSEYQDKLFQVAKKNQWTYEQLGILELETTMVLLGMTNPNNYQKVLAEELGKKPAELTTIVADIKTQVFDPIRASLMKLYTEDAISAPESIPTPVTTQAPVQKTAPENDTAVLEKSGITIEEVKPQKPEVASVSRGDVLGGIENPPKSTSKVLNQVSPGSAVPKAPYAGAASGSGIVASKLSATVAIPPKATDYSIPKMGSTTPPPKAPSQSDPYKEPLE
jgi:hypothetical protein